MRRVACRRKMSPLRRARRPAFGCRVLFRFMILRTCSLSSGRITYDRDKIDHTRARVSPRRSRAHSSPSSSLDSISLVAIACCATAAASGWPVAARLRTVTSICAARCCTSRTRAAPVAPAAPAAPAALVEPALAVAPAQRTLVHAAAKQATSRLSSSAGVPPCGWRSAAAHGSSHACAPG